MRETRALRSVAFGFLALLAIVASVRATPDDEALEKARETLRSDDPELAAGAVQVLIEEGSDESLKLVADHGAATRFFDQARLVGKSLAAKDEAMAIAQLKRLIKSNRRKPRRRERIALMAGQVPGEAGRSLLVALAKDKDVSVAVRTIHELGARAEEEARPVLLALLKSKRPDVVKAASQGLARLKSDKATMDVLYRLVETRDIGVGGMAAVAMGRMEGVDPYANRALERLLKKSKHESFHALVKLARAGKKPDASLLDRALKSNADLVREVGCELIGNAKLAGFQKRLLKVATSGKNWRTQVAAWLALRRTGAGEIVPELTKQLLKDGEHGYWAIQCAGCSPDPEYVPHLREAALDPEDSFRRELAQIALRSPGFDHGPTREFYLETWNRQRGTPKAEFAVIGVGHLRDDQSFEALISLLGREEKAKYRLWILRGLERLTGHYYRPDTGTWKEWHDVAGGITSYRPDHHNRKEFRDRIAKIPDRGVSAETETAVNNGIRWLHRHQQPGGYWSGHAYAENCAHRKNCDADGGVRSREHAYTALAILAMQGAGHTHLDGPYSEAIRRGFEHIVAHSNYDWSHAERHWAFAYEAAIVCQALCDGFALTGDPWLGTAAQGLIDYLARMQRPGAGWRYKPRDAQSDTSVMSWILMACVSARAAGLDLPQQLFSGPELWLSRVCEPPPPDVFEVFVRDEFRADNRYALDVSRDERGAKRTYRLRTDYMTSISSPSMCAVGLLCRIWLGWTRAHPYCIGSANEMLAKVPGYESGLEGMPAFYPYTWYYGSLAMYQMGGRYWATWREECLSDLVKHQRTDGCEFGSWRMPSSQYLSGMEGGGGTVYATVMAILSLESFYRYQPYLSRSGTLSADSKGDK